MEAARAIALTTAAVVGALVFAVAGAAAGTASSKGEASTAVRLTSVATAKQYLRSLGIDPSTVVFQRGTKNYAGPNCPGKGWSCTTSRRVVQIAPAKQDSARSPASVRWANNFECTPGNYPSSGSNGPSAQTCLTIQSGSWNSARCVEESDQPNWAQTCTIDQTGTNNKAFVLQDISTGRSSTSGSTFTQNSSQTATVTQKGVTNQLDATQRVNQTLKASTMMGTITENQDDQQSITVCQGGNPCTAPNSGQNDSKIEQSRYALARASGGVIFQNQDQNVPTDCNPDNGSSAPNLCAFVQQNSSTDNDSNLHQHDHLNEVATGTVGGNVNQKQQQAPSGIDGSALQPVPGPASNTNIIHEHLTDDASAPPGAHENQDPELFCCSHQHGGENSKVNGHMVAILRASEPLAVQNLEIDGFCRSNGRCLLVSHGKDNSDEATDRCQSQPSEGEALCSTFVGCQNPGTCTTTPPDDLVPTTVDLTTVGFDTLDQQYALNFVFPLTLPVSPTLP